MLGVHLPRLVAVLTVAASGAVLPVTAQPASASGCDTSFTGAVSSSWSVAANWDHGVPTATSNACVGSAVTSETSPVVIGGSVAVRSITGGGSVRIGDDSANVAAVTIGADGVTTASSLASIYMEQGTLTLAGAAAVTVSHFTGVPDTAVDLGSGGASVQVGYVDYRCVVHGQGTVTVGGGSSTGDGGGAAFTLDPGVSLHLTAGGSFSTDAGSGPGATVYADGGTLGLSPDGIRLVTAAALTGLTLSTPLSLDPSSPAIAVPTTIQGDDPNDPSGGIHGTVHVTEPLVLNGVHVASDGTLTADGTVTAQGQTVVDGTLDGAGSLSVPSGGLLLGSGTLTLPITISANAQMRGPVNLGSSLTVQTGAFWAWTWQQGPVAVGTVSLAGEYSLDGPDDVAVNSTQPLFDASGPVTITATTPPGATPQHQRSYRLEQDAGTYVVRAHDASSTVIVTQTAARVDGSYDLHVTVAGAPGEPATGYVLLEPGYCGLSCGSYGSAPLVDGQASLTTPSESDQTTFEVDYDGDSTHTTSAARFTPTPFVSPSTTTTTGGTNLLSSGTAVATAGPVVHAKVTDRHAKHLSLKLTTGKAGAGRTVLVEILRKGRWVTVARVRLSRSGSAEVVVRNLTRGSTNLRLVVPETPLTSTSTTSLSLKLL
jgi:hypothetical protein